MEDLTVRTLDVGLYSCGISKDHTAVDTAGEKRNKRWKRQNKWNFNIQEFSVALSSSRSTVY